MKNSMQNLVLMYQIDNDTKDVQLFKINEEFQNSIIVIGYKKRNVNTATGSVNIRTVRSLVKLPTVDPVEIVDYIQEILGTDVDNSEFTNLKTVAENYDSGKKYKLAINARIVTQEFALAIPRYGKGNAKLCVESYIKMLDKYKAFDVLTAKLTNTIRYAVRRHKESLLTKLIDQKTGLFSVAKLLELPTQDLNKICLTVDTRLHEGSKKGDKNRGILKRQSVGAPSLQTTKKEYILATSIFVDDEENFDKFPEILVAHDNTSEEFIKYRIERNTPSVLAETEEEEEEEESEEEGLPAGTEVESEEEESEE